ncbi:MULTISPECIES: hypothetical protein [Rhodococcus]|uniref:Uncharacterized protein n=1 Tax=Rhodococcus qingshengii TaxID=334542 RepID=A0A2A5IX07_RHOSG|nr:hypothetical protein [Rhodococcus qingshengii]PCK21652.1 hypothetical protein CHR55_33715 [Rhodococcus qingshengii]
MKKWQLYVLAAATATAATTGLDALSPHDPPTRTTTTADVDNEFGDLSDADEATKDRMRQDGADAGEARRREQLGPHEDRPAHAPRLKIPW